MAELRPKSLYERIMEATTDSEIREISDFMLLSKIRCHLPCKVLSVDYNNGTVDVEIQGKQDMGYGAYEQFPMLSDIPILEPHRTSRAYIITPIKAGDTGLLEFLDFNCSNYNSDGNTEPTLDPELHSLNSSVFINGYIPQSNIVNIENTDCPIIMGLNNKTFTLSVNEAGQLTIKASDIAIEADNVNVQGDKINIDSGNISIGNNTTIDGKVFLTHTHSNGNQGNPTGGVL